VSTVPRHILVVDDEPNIRKLLGGVLEDEGFRVDTAGNGDEAQAVLDDHPVDLVLLDVQLPGADGLTLLQRWRENGDAPPVVMMSGHATIDVAVKATRAGACDFIEKPIGVERLLVSIANVLRLGDLSRENTTLREALSGDRGEIIGACADIAHLHEEIDRTASSEARVLITGENGTGKELVARALHAASTRAQRPFIKINCAAIPSELLESELFGHERGAFTGAVATRRGKFELAQRGTLLLDEVGDMNPTTQAKLLRVLEEEEMERVGGEKTIPLDVRIFASTNQDLERLIADGEFRQDLYHRLKVVPIHVPPLRDRPGDVALLAAHYLDHFCATMGRPQQRLGESAIRALDAYVWPGNVRELRNLMERLVIMTDTPQIDAGDVAPLLTDATSDIGPSAAGPLAEQLAAFERRAVSRALDRRDGNVAAAARDLGLDRANLHRKLKRLGLD